jgi:hypothetical protein
MSDEQKTNTTTANPFFNDRPTKYEMPMPMNENNTLWEMYESLNDCTRAVGGAGFSKKQLEAMTAFELLEALANNRVRFMVIKENEDE